MCDGHIRQVVMGKLNVFPQVIRHPEEAAAPPRFGCCDLRGVSLITILKGFVCSAVSFN